VLRPEVSLNRQRRLAGGFRQHDLAQRHAHIGRGVGRSNTCVGSGIPPPPVREILAASRKVLLRPTRARFARAAARDRAVGILRRAASAGLRHLRPLHRRAVAIDVERSLPPPRRMGAPKRGGVESYDGRPIKPVDNGNVSGKHLARASRFSTSRCAPLADKPMTQYGMGACRNHHQGNDLYAERENLGRKTQLDRAEAALADGESFGASIPPFVTPEFVRSKWRAPRHHSSNINHANLSR